MPPKPIPEAQSDDNRAAWRAWMQSRVEEIHRQVTVFDVLQRNGIKLRYTDREGQVSCPFHGKDTNPSARVYPGDGRGPSHVWCFACNERWDAITLWRKFDGRDPEDFKFGAIIRDIESTYGIQTPPRPEGTGSYESEKVDSTYFRLLSLHTSCELRLFNNRRAFDMDSFLRVGIILDRLFKLIEEQSPAEELEKHLRAVLDRIGLKVRACPDG